MGENMNKKENYIEGLKAKIKENKRGKKYTTACIDYANRLLDNNLPVIFDFKHFSLLLGIESVDLLKLLYVNDDKVYTKVYIPKKSGDKRELIVPTVNIKYIQRWILDNILEKIKISEFATGFRKGYSIVNNAEIHLNSDCIINMDIKDFFPSITQERVFRIFKYYGYTKEVSFILSKFCTYKGILPQGAPTSPYISNICSMKVDKRISKLCDKFEAKYSRYADDITISGNDGIKKCIEIIDLILKEEGFVVNNKKTRVLTKNKRQEITGLNINSGKVTISKKYKREIYKEIYFSIKYGVEEHLNFINCKKSFYKEHLYGKVYFVNMVEPEVAKKMFLQLEKIKWEY